MYKEVFSRHRILAVVTVIMILGVFLTRLPQAQAHFVIASWDYPDEYGQGIYAVTVYQYIDADWENLANFYWTNTSTETTVEINHTSPLKVEMRSWLNNTVVGAASITDGQNYLRHYAEIYCAGVGLVFSKQNGSWSYQNDYDDMFMYYYEMTFDDFLPETGMIYTVLLTYEIFM